MSQYPSENKQRALVKRNAFPSGKNNKIRKKSAADGTTIHDLKRNSDIVPGTC